jgi:signal peptidase I
MCWIPGDNLSIKDGMVYIDGKILQLPERATSFSYKVALDGKTPIDFEYLLKEMDVTDPVMFTDQTKRYTLF